MAISSPRPPPLTWRAGPPPAADVAALRARVERLARQFPLYAGLEDWGLTGR